jgi:hypothetical protein
VAYTGLMLDLDKEWFVRQQQLKQFGAMNITNK